MDRLLGEAAQETGIGEQTHCEREDDVNIDYISPDWPERVEKEDGRRGEKNEGV